MWQATCLATLRAAVSPRKGNGVGTGRRNANDGSLTSPSYRNRRWAVTWSASSSAGCMSLQRTVASVAGGWPEPVWVAPNDAFRSARNRRGASEGRSPASHQVIQRIPGRGGGIATFPQHACFQGIGRSAESQGGSQELRRPTGRRAPPAHLSERRWPEPPPEPRVKQSTSRNLGSISPSQERRFL